MIKCKQILAVISFPNVLSNITNNLNIYVYQQIVGIPMATNYAIFKLISFLRSRICTVSALGGETVSKLVNLTSRYIGDGHVLSIIKQTLEIS